MAVLTFTLRSAELVAMRVQGEGKDADPGRKCPAWGFDKTIRPSGGARARECERVEVKSCCEFSTSREAITSKQHLDGDIPGDVRVIVSEAAEQREAVATLRKPEPGKLEGDKGTMSGDGKDPRGDAENFKRKFGDGCSGT